MAQRSGRPVGRKLPPRPLAVPRAARIHFCGEPVPLEREDVARHLSTVLLQNVSYTQYLTRFRKRAIAEYFPVIERYLRKYNIPQDFKYLAVVESGLKADAVSSKGAVGYWQLMPETARELGLTISPTVDERKDLLKSTDAACRYLQILYRNVHSWTMVAASYNGGVGRMQSHMRAQKQSNYYFLTMNQETSDYLYKIVAIKEFFNNPGYLNSLDAKLMASLGNQYERERAEAMAKGLIPIEEPDPVGTPIEPKESLQLSFEIASVDSLLGALARPARVSTALFRGDVEASLVKPGKLAIGQTWVFKLVQNAQIGDQKLGKDDLLYAVIDDVDQRSGQLFLRGNKLISAADQRPYSFSLICLNPRTGLAGVPIPKATQLKPGWTIGWKAM